MIPLEEVATLSFLSGEAIAGRFALTPNHLKRLSMVIDKQLKAYEKEYGKIDPNLTNDQATSISA